MSRPTLPSDSTAGLSAVLLDPRAWIAVRDHFPSSFKLFFEDAPIGMLVTDRHGVILEANQALCALLACERPDLLGRSARSLTHPDNQEREEAARSPHAASPAETGETETRLRRRDGSEVHVLVRGRALRDGEGLVIGGISQIVDITARKLTEAALRESEERFRRAFDDAPVGMSIQALDGRVLQVNAELARITGRGEETLLRDGFDPVLHPEDRAPHDRLLDLIRCGQVRTHRLEERYLRPDGRIAWVERSISAVTDARNRPVYVLNQIQDITEARASREAAAREPEERFHVAFERAPIGMALIGTDGRFLRVNRAFCQITGYTMEEMLARSFVDLTHPEDLERDTDALAGFLAGDIDAYITEKRYLRKDGKVAWVQLHVSSVSDPGNRLLYFISQAVDITSRKRAEQVLWEGEERFRIAFAEAPIGMALIASTGRMLRVNQRFCALLGLSESEILRTDLTSLAQEEDRERLRQIREAVARDALTRQESECRYRRKDGAPLRGLLILSAVRDRRGATAYLIAQLQDVTEQRRAEEALRESETRYRRLVEGTRAIPWEYDCDTRRFTYVGPQMERLLGVPAERVCAPGFWESVLHPDDRDAVVACRAEALGRGEDHEMEYRLRASDGRIVWVHELVAVVGGDSGRRALRGYLIDVSARHRRESAQRRGRETERIGAVARTLARDYDNVVTAILGYAELLRASGDTDARARDYLEEILKSGRRAASLTQTLLALGRRRVVASDPDEESEKRDAGVSRAAHEAD